MRLLLLCALFSLSLSLAWRDPGLCINNPARVSVCYYNNTLAISRTLSPSLESIPSLFLCGNRKMRPPLIDFDFSSILLLAGDVSLNPGPSVHGLRLRTVNARSMQDKAPALSHLVTSKGIDLLGITVTWLTPNETSTELAEMTPQGFAFFHESRAWRRGGWVGLFVSSAHKFSKISLQTRMWSVMPYCPQYLSPPPPALLLLSAVSYKISRPTCLHSLMIWLLLRMCSLDFAVEH